MEIAEKLCKEFPVSSEHMNNIIRLIEDGNTIPFIARYRKEMHGSCNDQMLREISERLAYLKNLGQRKKEIAEAISAQGKMSDTLERQIFETETLAALEEIYRPYRQKRKTRAMIAREKGLEPLAEILLFSEGPGLPASRLTEPYLRPEHGVNASDDALAGASDILAELMAGDPLLHRKIKEQTVRNGVLVSEGRTNEETVYSLYYDFREAVSKIPPHRVLAVNRGEREEVLRVSIEVNEEAALELFDRAYLKPRSSYPGMIQNAAADSYRRLVFPSVEREIRRELTEKAEEQAIRMFGKNLKPLLMQPPLKGKRVLAVDPAYRTGCKLAVVDENGKVLDTGVMYPTPPQNRKEESACLLHQLIDRHGVSCISIGNGTASREAEAFVAETIQSYQGKVTYALVNEAGASVYSASRLGAEEFPQFDVSIRSAVSIARRLQDPLSELVKIDPQSIGVGQYQHDVPQARLQESLRGVVEDCVNAVGVDLNTASPAILRYVSGISAAVAGNIVAYRDEKGAFASRTELKKVKGLGPKAFEQCAGFLRIPGAKEPLDSTGVHPESYGAARKLLSMIGRSSDDIRNGIPELEREIHTVGMQETASTCGVGIPTVLDIVQELSKPGRDIRDSLPPPILRTDVLCMEDLKPGMILKGTVRNVIDFGVFVDIGVHQDGLVHISQMSEQYVKHPSELVKVGDIVEVRILSADPVRKRISLSMLL